MHTPMRRNLGTLRVGLRKRLQKGLAVGARSSQQPQLGAVLPRNVALATGREARARAVAGGVADQSARTQDIDVADGLLVRLRKESVLGP